jgi:hypothetical protein
MAAPVSAFDAWNEAAEKLFNAVKGVLSLTVGKDVKVIILKTSGKMYKDVKDTSSGLSSTGITAWNEATETVLESRGLSELVAGKDIKVIPLSGSLFHKLVTEVKDVIRDSGRSEGNKRIREIVARLS